MLFRNPNIIFIHVPKTGGNFFQSAMQPLSEDVKTIVRHQDGTDRFGIRGPATKLKHQTLHEYRKVLGCEFKNFRIAVIARHPVARLVSLWFSPHRWLEVKDGSTVLRGSVNFDIDAFSELVAEQPSALEYLAMLEPSVMQLLRTEDRQRYQSACSDAVSLVDDILQFDKLPMECAAFAKRYFPDDDLMATHGKINASANDVLRRKMESNPEVIEVVLNSHHAVDLAIAA